jgi:putative FmdB family regulatory protein
MPIYEYSCPNCNGRFQKLVQGFRDPEGLSCPRCASTDVRRAISRFATLRSEDARVEALADPSTFADLDETDPHSVARWARRLGKELGEDAGEDWDELVDELIEDELGDEAGGRGKPKEDDLGWG